MARDRAGVEAVSKASQCELVGPKVFSVFNISSAPTWEKVASISATFGDSWPRLVAFLPLGHWLAHLLNFRF